MRFQQKELDNTFFSGEGRGANWNFEDCYLICGERSRRGVQFSLVFNLSFVKYKFFPIVLIHFIKVFPWLEYFFFFLVCAKKPLGLGKDGGGCLVLLCFVCVCVGRFAYGLCCMETTITLISNFFNEKILMAGPQAPTPDPDGPS